MIEKLNNNELDNETPGDCQRMRKWFPITKDNVYGVIPLLGVTASCFTASILMTIFDYSVRDGWFFVWFFFGFLTFVATQALWGFHAKNRRFLLLWMMCKIAELLGAVGGIIAGLFIGGPYLCGLIAPSFILLFLLLILLHVGYTKARNFENPEKSVFADTCLDKIITK